MDKTRVDYACRSCGHQESILVYEEDSWAAATHGFAESNRDRHRRMIESTCSKCGKSGFSLAKDRRSP